ncbi:MAG: flagellar hook-length control protein FliK [Deltaproteobacteria bacterium]|nr:flagellar hook-length control protein FliK [Deltaproteobacteria bacterium]
MRMFKPGSMLMLKVLELRGDRALIDFGSFQTTAKIKIPLTVGEELLVKVLESGQQPKLVILNPEPKNISSTDPVSQRLENLSEENFKKIQTDIKQILNQTLTTQSAKTIPADVLSADIINQQGRTVSQLDPAEPFQVFTYALPLEEENQAAKLKIYYPKKQKTGSKKGFQISLLLNMDRLGELRTDFHLLEKDLTVTFFVKNPSAKTKIQENQLDLQELLNPLFNQTLVRVIVCEKKIKDFDRQDVQTTSDRRVDVRV